LISIKKMIARLLVLAAVVLALFGAFKLAKSRNAAPPKRNDEATLLVGENNRREFSRRANDQPTAERTPTYYVSPNGNDSNEGTSNLLAWRTIDKVNKQSFPAGTQILFEGGQHFEGSLLFEFDDAGTPARPIVVSSYGEGRATIQGGGGNGIVVHNTGGFTIANINVVGSGRTNNESSGISFINDLDGDVKIDYVRIELVDVSGFGKYGITVDGNKGLSGYRDVGVEHVESHDNGLAGIYVQGDYNPEAEGFAHENVFVRYARSYNNPGVPGRKESHSGSGIILSDVDHGVIERSVAHDNGWQCESSLGGPIGIWAWGSNAVTIQYNESHHNRVAGIKDGGGFDLDGGMTNSVMQYNYSHDNDGAGYLMMQFVDARPYANNTLRYNISQNDGRKNGYGGIHLVGEINNTEIYNNTIYMSPAPDGEPPAIEIRSTKLKSWFLTEVGTNTQVRNNIFIAAGDSRLVRVVGNHPGLLFQGNDYYSSGGKFQVIWDGSEYTSLDDWRAAIGQERLGKANFGMSVDPQLNSPGDGGTLNNADLLITLTGYKLRADSPLIDAGVDLREARINPGGHDYFGAVPPQREGFDVGAHEIEVETAQTSAAKAP
jgi:hypothetical protein